MRRSLSLPVVAVVLSACGGGALDAAGRHARSIEGLWWLMFWLGLVPLVVVVAIVLVIYAGRRPPAMSEHRIMVTGGVGLSVVLLIPVVVMTTLVERDRAAGGDGSLTIAVAANQFWWDVTYPDPGGDGVFRTANEIHVPVGEEVTLRVTSNDVIHSFWVPELQGKIDLIPGRVNELSIHAEEAGVFHGRCAEFCGLGHARMNLIVVASPSDEFEQWRQEQSAPASVDVSGSTRQIFADGCAPCHTVRGLYDNEAFEGTFGPDLTHLASRRMIGANILPNTPEALARWIVDPHGVKPGNRMPDVGLSPEELNAVLDLLEELE